MVEVVVFYYHISLIGTNNDLLDGTVTLTWWRLKDLK